MNYNFELLKKPTPFSLGNMNLWDNKYIAQNVLKKHLNYDINSGSRKLETIYKTVDWINNKFVNAVKILDIGCGPGLYATPFMHKGFIYTGIDISQYQIEYAKKHNSNKNKIKFYQADFHDWAFDDKYDIVFMDIFMNGMSGVQTDVLLLRFLPLSIMKIGMKKEIGLILNPVGFGAKSHILSLMRSIGMTILIWC